MTRPRTPPAAWLALLLAANPSAAAAYGPGKASPPLPAREFRGVWVATVNNIDWPSKRGLPVAQQKAELLALLDRAAQLRLNAVVFQVRPACDALYASRFEPWSEYLTGQMGAAPQPYYDPLEIVVSEAHRRGLELHAWFNPFRARHPSGTAAISANHISQTRPALVRSYGKHLWLDPGDPAVQEHSLNVILDVVRRYDIDGIHLDDYFYPYPENNAAGREMDFPDDSTWRRYVQSGGQRSRADWRRENVNSFLRRLYSDVKAQKPCVKVGVSPFGIWRPGFPSSVRGFDAFEKLYADSRLWFASGWLDYFSPQLYWSTDAPQQSYPVLLKWWAGQNSQRRHLWPGHSAYRTALVPGELTRQVQATRRQARATGDLLWSIKPLVQNKGGVADELSRVLYTQPALVPASPWLGRHAPLQPSSLAASVDRGDLQITWQSAGQEVPWLWLLQWKEGKTWQTEIFPGAQRSARLNTRSGFPASLALRAVDRCGNLSRAAALQRSEK
ncbi:MAG: family 10 glycosylhydrolase [Verrucomicrobia bacterium]|nr:family 10 glycosylhydrolase [Verrucomicrobiota bacterium]